METRTYPASFAVAILDAAVAKGVDRDMILNKAGVAPEILDAQRGRVRAKTLMEVTRVVAEELNDESLGSMKSPIKPGTFAMMCYACVGAPTLRTAVNREGEFYRLVTDNFAIRLEERGDTAFIFLEPDDSCYDPHNYMVPSMLGITFRWMSWMIKQKVILDHAAMTCPRPEVASDYNFLFSSPVKFSETANYICFPSAFLDKAVQQNEKTLAEFLENGFSGLMSHPRDEDTLPARVQRILRDKVSEDFPEIDEIAEQLHMTPATLRRKLKREGSSYQQIKDDIRRDEAIYLLSRGTMSIEDIAETVGFSEPTSFFRAFKRWTGVTPRSYLKSAGDD